MPAREAHLNRKTQSKTTRELHRMQQKGTLYLLHSVFIVDAQPKCRASVSTHRVHSAMMRWNDATVEFLC